VNIFKNKIGTYIVSVVAVVAIGFAGTFFTTPSIGTWYAGITKPSFNPPAWVFGPVWTILFVMIGLSLGMVLNSARISKYRSVAIKIFIVQLVLNLAWSYLFFSLHRPDFSAIEILILFGMIGVNIYYASKVHKTAGWLLVPYIVWVGFAAVLNITIWSLN
jgi:benzodiazapine receptor